MTLSTARSLCSHGAVAAAFVAMASSGSFSLPLQAGFFLLLAAALLKGERGPGWLPWVLTALTLASGLVLVLAMVRGGVDIVVGTAGFGAVLALNRVLSRRSPADDALIYLTSLLMLAGGAALTGEVLYGVCFTAYLGAVTVGLTLSHLDREAEAAGAGPAERSALLSPALLRSLGLLSLASLGVSLGFFLFFPRLNTRWFGRLSGATQDAMTGFSNTVQLGGHGVLRDDPRPALRVTLPELSEAELPERLDLFWRGEGLDRFDGRTWSMAKHPARVLRAQPVPGFHGLHALVDVLPVANTNTVFVVGDLTAAVLRSPSAPGVSRGIQLQEGGPARVVPSPEGPFSYEVWSTLSEASPALAHLGADYPEAVRTQDLQLPDNLDPRIPQLARSWTTGLTDPYALAEAVRRHLAQDYRYSLQLPGAVADPLAHFLFERREGHCEYFSTAMVVLLRTQGVPAREVTGFVGGIRAPAGNYFLVRAGDAHSWAEVYFPGRGFVPFDPTPLGSRELEPRGVQAWLAALADGVTQRWQAAVMDYNLASQVGLARGALHALAQASELFRRDGQPGALPWRRLALVLAAAGAVALLWRRRRSPAPAAPSDEAAAAYRELLEQLRRRGLRRRGPETARAFATRLRGQGRIEATAALELTGLYEQARFAGRPWGEQERARARALLQRLARLPRPG